MAKTIILNIVATADLNQKIELEKLSKLKEFRYDPNKYGGRVAYFCSPHIKGKVSIFSSGKIISVGAKDEKEAIYYLEYVRDFLARIGIIRPINLRYNISNIVVMVSFEYPIDVEKIAKRRKIIYEPEQFPAAILRISYPIKATALLFSSGKAIITGIKSLNQIEPVVQKITKIITNDAFLGYR